MTIPNDEEPLSIYFERLPNEPDPRRLAQRLRRRAVRKSKRQAVAKNPR